MLIKSMQFHQPGKKATQASDTVFEIVIVDGTEQPVERSHVPAPVPEKRQPRHYCGKKKHHTQKAQLFADFKMEKILVTDIRIGSTHDF